MEFLSFFVPLQFLGAVAAVDVSVLGDKAFLSKVHSALLAGEAVIVPRSSLIVHHISGFSKTGDGVLTAAALLGHVCFVTVDAVKFLLMRGEASSSQRLHTHHTHQTLRVPRLILIVHSTCCDGLPAGSAVFREFALVAAAAVNVLVFSDEALRADRLLTLITRETVIMKHVAFVLHTLCTC